MNEEQQWTPQFVLLGMAMDDGQPVQVGFPFRECLRCGAAVSTEQTGTHDQWHDDTPVKIGRVANDGRIKLS